LAVAYPELMDGVVPIETAPQATMNEKKVADRKAQLAADPQWNGGGTMIAVVPRRVWLHGASRG
jgi:hypothetical protein